MCQLLIVTGQLLRRRLIDQDHDEEDNDHDEDDDDDDEDYQWSPVRVPQCQHPRYKQDDPIQPSEPGSHFDISQFVHFLIYQNKCAEIIFILTSFSHVFALLSLFRLVSTSVIIYIQA